MVTVVFWNTSVALLDVAVGVPPHHAAGDDACCPPTHLPLPSTLVAWAAHAHRCRGYTSRFLPCCFFVAAYHDLPPSPFSLANTTPAPTYRPAACAPRHLDLHTRLRASPRGIRIRPPCAAIRVTSRPHGRRGYVDVLDGCRQVTLSALLFNLLPLVSSGHVTPSLPSTPLFHTFYYQTMHTTRDYNVILMTC